MVQQFYVIRRMPAPGSQAERDLRARRERKGKSFQKLSLKGIDPDRTDGAPADVDVSVNDEPVTARQRQQPMSKKRAKKAGPPRGPTARPTGKTAGSASGPSAGGATPQDRGPQDAT
jgi:YidC/Oxa1 family membrane protein insertase